MPTREELQTARNRLDERQRQERERIFRNIRSPHLRGTPVRGFVEDDYDSNESPPNNFNNMAGLLGVTLRKEDLLLQPAQNLPMPREFLGIEVEVENWDLDNSGGTQPWWNITRDGSLRTGGVEFVFKKPLFGQDIIAAIDWLWARMHEPNCTERCGIHIHLNVTDMSCEHLVKMLALYALVERVIFKFIGDGRDTSNFCLPWYKADAHIPTFIRYVGEVHKFKESQQHKKGKSYASAAVTVQRAVGLLQNIPRYSALNLASLPRFGTVEFRHMQTTTDKEKLLQWIHIVLGLKAACYSLPDEDWLRLFSEHRGSGFIREFFPQHAATVLANAAPDCLDEDMWPMLPTVQQLLVNPRMTQEERERSAKAAEEEGETGGWNSVPLGEDSALSNMLHQFQS